MNVNEMAAVADHAAERHQAARDRGHAALVALTSARAGLTVAEQAQDSTQAALAGLADGHLAGTPAREKDISVAILALESADRALVWANALISAGQRALQAAQDELRTAEQAAVDAAEAARRSALHSRVLALAAGRAA